MRRVAQFFWPSIPSSGLLAVYLSGVVLTLMGITSQWLWLPLSAPLSAVDLPWWAFSSDGKFNLSFGAVLIALLAGGLAAVRSERSEYALACFIAMIAVIAYFPMHLLAVDTSWVQTYLNESVARADLQLFLVTQFLPNSGREPSFVYVGSFEYLPDRLAVVWYLLGWGWKVAIIGMGLILFALQSGRLLSNRAFVSAIVLTLAIFLGVGGLPMLANYWQRQGDALSAAGRNDQALAAYGRALRFDRGTRGSEPLAFKVSKLYYQQWGASHPFAQLHLATLDEKQKRLDDAAVRLRLAGPGPTSVFTETLHRQSMRKLALIEIEAGVVRYKQGATRVAIDRFRRALAVDPGMIQGRFMLATALLDVRQIRDSLVLLENLAATVYSASFKADFYSTIGDCYTASGDLPKAREAYLTAYNWDKKDNFRAVKGISGT